MKRTLLLLLLVLSLSCEKENQEQEIENLSPTDFQVSISAISTKSAKISWTESTDPELSKIKYSIYLGDDLVIENINDLEFQLTDLTPITNYEGRVVAVDTDQKQREIWFGFSTISTQNPTGFQLSIIDITTSTAKLLWQASTDPDGGNIVYRVYLDDKLIEDNLNTLDCMLNELEENTTYKGRVVAVDEEEKESFVEFTFKTVTNPLKVGLIANYSFCGDTNDEAGNGHHGTIMGSVAMTADRFGNDNCALDFPGTSEDYINVPFSEDFNFSAEESFSISLWYQGGSDAGGDLEFFILKENPNVPNVGTDYHVGIYDCNNPSFGSQYSPIAFAPINSCPPTIDPTWHHVVAIYTNKVWQLYVDNKLLDTNTSGYSIFQSANAIKIGKEFQGKLDDIRLYSRTVGEAEISALFESSE